MTHWMFDTHDDNVLLAEVMLSSAPLDGITEGTILHQCEAVAVRLLTFLRS